MSDNRKLGRQNPGELLQRRLPGGGSAYYRPADPSLDNPLGVDQLAYTRGDGWTCLRGHVNNARESVCAMLGCGAIRDGMTWAARKPKDTE